MADAAASPAHSSSQWLQTVCLLATLIFAAIAGGLNVYGHRIPIPVELSLAVTGLCAAATVFALLALVLGARRRSLSDRAPSAQVTELRASLKSMRNQAARLARERDELLVEAEAANLAKGEFLATISHEIRTPLNGIIPLLEMLQGCGLKGESADYLNTAYQSSRHLLAIIDNILDYTKIDSGKLELETVGVQIDELLASVTQLMGRSAERRGVRIETRVDPDVKRTYRGDPVRLRQVLTNLVSNAVKFTHHGRVKVTVSKRSETADTVELLFAVRDTGIGMNAQALRRVFEPFSQADASTTRKYGGTGLGLAICQRLITLMGGDIGVKSELGRGTVFWFSAPLKKASGDVTGVRETLEGARVLAVSPDSILRARIERQLGELGLQASSSDSLRDALHKMRSAAAMGSSWAIESVIIDYEALGAKARNLTRAIGTDPQLRSAKLLALMQEGSASGLAPNEQIHQLDRQCSSHDLHTALEQLFEIREVRGDGHRLDPNNLQFLDPNKRPETPPPPGPRAKAKSEAASKPTEKASTIPTGAKVLLVEDNPVNLAVAKKIVGQTGVEIAVARNGQEAVDAHAESAFALILMDCQMPVMDGYSATQAIREAESATGSARTPIVAMTANAMAGDRQKCLDAGMDDYLSKPLKPALVESIMTEWLSKKNTPAPNSTANGDQAMTANEAGSVIDESVLGELVDIMGSDINELIEAYLEDAPRLIESLRFAADRSDVEGMVAPAHTLKSTSANLGAMQLSTLAKDVEHQAREGNVDNPDQHVSRIESQYAAVNERLSRLMA